MTPETTTAQTDAGELALADVDGLRAGDVLHFTNRPGKHSRPVVVVHDRQAVVRASSGKVVYAMADELSRYPRTGLGGQRAGGGPYGGPVVDAHAWCRTCGNELIRSDSRWGTPGVLSDRDACHDPAGHTPRDVEPF